MAEAMPAIQAEHQDEALFRDAVEAVQDFAIFLLDHNGCITSWNSGAEYILGYKASEIVGQPLGRLFTPEDEAGGEHEQELLTAASQGRAANERWHMRKDGTSFWATGVLTSLRNATGGLKGFVKIIRDRTDWKEIEKTLSGRAEALLAAEERKNLFIATLAHELRNPLAPIVYSVQILRRRVGDHHNLCEPLDIIEQQAEQIRRLVDDLLDVVRARTGKVVLNKQVVQLGVVIQRAVDAVQPLTESCNHAVHVSLPQEPIWLDADLLRLQQVFVNLLNNAAKYTEEGGSIWVSTTVEDGEAVVRVRDTGVGIPTEMLPHIFDLFTQADDNPHRTHGGLGIGLTLVKNLVELHGGTIQVHSEGPGKGSEFTVRLPIRIGGHHVRP
jgi:PAS domain S-box-containing protein